MEMEIKEKDMQEINNIINMFPSWAANVTKSTSALIFCFDALEKARNNLVKEG